MVFASSGADEDVARVVVVVDVNFCVGFDAMRCETSLARVAVVDEQRRCARVNTGARYRCIVVVVVVDGCIAYRAYRVRRRMKMEMKFHLFFIVALVRDAPS